MKEPVLSTIRDTFSDLASRHGMKVRSEVAEPPEYRVLYCNSATGMEVVVDWSELRPFVWLHRLQAGRMPVQENPDDAYRLSTVDADDILILRSVTPSPAGKMLARADVATLTPLLAEYAEALQNGCADVLAGDLSVFDELLPLIRERARRARDRS